MSEEIKQISWWERIKESFKGILTGIILIGISIYLVFWNENHSIKTKLSLIEVSNLVIQIPEKPVNPNHDENVVYLTGLATTNEKLHDDLLDVTVNAINLNRQVQMYQWEEHQNSSTQSNVGGSQTQTINYTYQKKWSSELINSDNFNESPGHTNPKEMKVSEKNQYAKNVTLGDFKLTHEQITQINNSQPIILGDTELIKIRKTLRAPATINNDLIYIGKNPTIPEIGDLKISLSAVYPQQVSLIAVQIGSTFEPYIAEAGEQVMLLESGYIPPNIMIEDALEKNKIMTYWIRLLSLFLMIVGFSLLFKPLVVIADFLPILGTILSYGNGLFSFIIGISLWGILFCISWIIVRPLGSLSLMGFIIGIIIFLYQIKKHQNKLEKQE